MEGKRVIVLRCKQCGDTYPAHDDDPIKCPTCGSDQAEVAGEPLL
jgi:Zn finger protein HypA/HybF involved in hydrogenase expression